MTYELSLVDQTGHLDRVEANFTKGHELGVRITDGSHTGIRRIAGDATNGGNWATSLRPEAEGTAAVTPLNDTQLSPFLVIKVNGVRIAARGGNWGTDDWRKRVSRETLEPYFRLHRDAHVNIIRNWVGQNTEDTFYDLADEYGLMVLNDFWASTQDYQLEPADVNLFLDNAKDVVKRYRNHPSIILWFGRNEGVPQPLLNEGLEDLIYRLDGTRWYTGSSNRVNLQNSGPYAFKTPDSYFTEHARGFSVEVGTASFPTLEAFRATVPQSEQWPISDTWTYHDWHPDSNGSTKPFETTLANEFGAPTSLPDFERKAQMLNLESHRAIFEGMNAGLWTQNSGRLLWMTQPAWPSTMWQIISHDYDTQASYYGVKAASEPVHIQMNLPDRQVIVVNNPIAEISGATATVEIYGIDGQQIAKISKPVAVPGGAITAPMDFGISEAVASHKVVILKLTLTAQDGSELSRNVYWQGSSDTALQTLNALPQQSISLDATRTAKGLDIRLTNLSKTVVLQNKLTLLDNKGDRILPAYYSENYISLVPGSGARSRSSTNLQVRCRCHYGAGTRGQRASRFPRRSSPGLPGLNEQVCRQPSGARVGAQLPLPQDRRVEDVIAVGDQAIVVRIHLRRLFVIRSHRVGVGGRYVFHLVFRMGRKGLYTPLVDRFEARGAMTKKCCPAKPCLAEVSTIATR